MLRRSCVRVDYCQNKAKMQFEPNALHDRCDFSFRWSQNIHPKLQPPSLRQSHTCFKKRTHSYTVTMNGQTTTTSNTHANKQQQAYDADALMFGCWEQIKDELRWVFCAFPTEKSDELLKCMQCRSCTFHFSWSQRFSISILVLPIKSSLPTKSWSMTQSSQKVSPGMVA